jgi:hypothetical protein
MKYTWSENGGNLVLNLTITIPLPSTSSPEVSLAVPGPAETAPQAQEAPKVEERLPNPAAGLKLTVTNMEGPSVVRGTGIPKIPDSPDTRHAVVAAEEPKQRKRRRTKAEMEAAKGTPQENETRQETEAAIAQALDQEPEPTPAPAVVQARSFKGCSEN